MNWNLGFLRLWVVVSVLWMGGNFITDFPTDAVETLQKEKISSTDLRSINDEELIALYRKSKTPENTAIQDETIFIEENYATEGEKKVAIAHLLGFAILLFSLPTVLYAIGFIVRYIYRGFRHA